MTPVTPTTTSTTEAENPRGIVAELRAHPATSDELENFAQTQEKYAKWAERERASRLADPKGGAAFVDTTTLHSALPLLSDWVAHRPTPINLLDLCTIIDAIVMFDRVYFFTGELAEQWMLPDLGSVFQAIDDPYHKLGNVGEEYVGSAAFGGLWDEANSFFSGLRTARTGVATREREALERGWKRVLEIPPELAVGDPHAPGQGPVAAPIARDLSELSETQSRWVGPETTSDERAQIARIVGESNILGYVNEQIANMIDLPYLPNTARIPAVRRYRVERGEHVARELAALDTVDDAYRRRLEEAKLGTVRLPLLAAVVFAKNPTTPRELVESILDLRGKAERLREYRRDHARLLLSAYDATNGEAMKKARRSAAELQSAVEREGRRLRDVFEPSDVWGGLAGGGPLLLDASANHLLVAVTVLAGMAVMPAERITRAVQERLFRPHLWLLTNLAESGQALTNARARRAIATIWDMDEAHAEQVTSYLNRLSETRPSA